MTAECALIVVRKDAGYWSKMTSERPANAMRSLAPRSAAERGEGWGEGQVVAPLTRTRVLVES